MSEIDTFSVRLPADVRRKVDKFAKVTKRSRSFIVKEAVVAYIDEREAYLEAIDEAIQEADKGVFISGEAIDRWLASWGTDNVLPMPEPDIFPEDSK